jgi:hypothetical protein
MDAGLVLPFDLTPTTLAVLVGLLVFSVYQWLRWRERQAWFARLWLEHEDDTE